LRQPVYYQRGFIARVGKRKYAYRILVEEPEGKIPPGKRRLSGNDIKMSQKMRVGHELDSSGSE
jgi:hypothetical protein